MSENLKNTSNPLKESKDLKESKEQLLTITSKAIDEIYEQISIEHQKVKEAEQAKIQAENQLKALNNQLEKAVEFQKGKYQDLIKEIFEQPSKQARKLIVITALLSIFLSSIINTIIGISLNIKSSNQTTRLFNKYQIQNVRKSDDL